jgi:hypothetical protein
MQLKKKWYGRDWPGKEVKIIDFLRGVVKLSKDRRERGDCLVQNHLLVENWKRFHQGFNTILYHPLGGSNRNSN